MANVFSRSLKTPLTRETDTIKSGAILQNFNFGMLKLTQTPILQNCQVPNGFFGKYSGIEVLQKFLSFLLCQILW